MEKGTSRCLALFFFSVKRHYRPQSVPFYAQPNQRVIAVGGTWACPPLMPVPGVRLKTCAAQNGLCFIAQDVTKLGNVFALQMVPTKAVVAVIMGPNVSQKHSFCLSGNGVGWIRQFKFVAHCLLQFWGWVPGVVAPGAGGGWF
jgi:hypothetical protein